MGTVARLANLPAAFSFVAKGDRNRNEKRRRNVVEVDSVQTWGTAMVRPHKAAANVVGPVMLNLKTVSWEAIEGTGRRYGLGWMESKPAPLKGARVRHPKAVT
jgi:hypothetical protein